MSATPQIGYPRLPEGCRTGTELRAGQTNLTSESIRFPIYGRRALRVTRSTLRPRSSPSRRSKRINAMKPTGREKETRTSTSLSSCAVPDATDPNTPISLNSEDPDNPLCGQDAANILECDTRSGIHSGILFLLEEGVERETAAPLPEELHSGTPTVDNTFRGRCLRHRAISEPRPALAISPAIAFGAPFCICSKAFCRICSKAFALPSAVASARPFPPTVFPSPSRPPRLKLLELLLSASARFCRLFRLWYFGGFLHGTFSPRTLR